MRRISQFILPFIMLTHVQIQAQQLNTDSLWTVWKDHTEQDTNRLKALHKYIWNVHMFSHPDSAYVLAVQESDFAETTGHRVHVGNGHMLMGTAQYKLSNYPQALKDLRIASDIFSELGKVRGVADVLGNIGMIYLDMGDIPASLQEHIKALKIFEQLGYELGIARAHHNIGVCHVTSGNFAQATVHLELAQKLYKGLGRVWEENGVLHDLASAYSNSGKMQQAEHCLEQSIQQSGQIKDIIRLGDSHVSLGKLYYNTGRKEKSHEYFSTGLRLYEEANNIAKVALAEANIGHLYQLNGDHEKAKEYCQNALKAAKEVGYLKVQQFACECLFNVHKTLGSYKEALSFHEMHKSLSDSLSNTEGAKKLVRLEMMYDFDKREALNRAEQEKKDELATAELQKRNIQRNASIGGLGLMMLLATVFLFQRNRISREKARSEELLLNILPEETAQELKEKGRADARLIDHVTVLFTDFKGFTQMSEQLGPKELVADLHECFSAFDNICEKHGIEKIKTIGDAYMAAGGLPTPNTTHAHDVVNAAMEMAAFVAVGKANKQASGQPYFEVRIGVHTGPVVAGIVGIKKFQYDIWGDTVNTASRMESSGEEGKVNISESTYQLVKDSFTCEYRGEVEAKGKGKMGMWFVASKA